MASRRAGHGQILMPNGQVLIMAGINSYILAGGLGPAVPT